MSLAHPFKAHWLLFGTPFRAQEISFLMSLAPIWEALKQGASKISFVIILAPFWDPFWDQFGLILGILVFCVFWKGFLMALASIDVPTHLQNETQNGGQNQDLKMLAFASIHYALATFMGGLKIISFCYCFFGTLLWKGFGCPFWWFWLSFGVPLGTFWGTNI